MRFFIMVCVCVFHLTLQAEYFLSPIVIDAKGAFFMEID